MDKSWCNVMVTVASYENQDIFKTALVIKMK